MNKGLAVRARKRDAACWFPARKDMQTCRSTLQVLVPFSDVLVVLGRECTFSVRKRPCREALDEHNKGKNLEAQTVQSDDRLSQVIFIRSFATLAKENQVDQHN